MYSLGNIRRMSGVHFQLDLHALDRLITFALSRRIAAAKTIVMTNEGRIARHVCRRDRVTG